MPPPKISSDVASRSVDGPLCTPSFVFQRTANASAAAPACGPVSVGVSVICLDTSASATAEDGPKFA